MARVDSVERGKPPAGGPGGAATGAGARWHVDPPRGDLATMVATVGLLMTVSAVGAAVQTEWALAAVGVAAADVHTASRLAANLVSAAALAGTLVVLGAHRRTRFAEQTLVVVVAGVCAATLRLATQHLLHGYINPPPGIWWPEMAAGLPSAWLSGAVGLVAVSARRRLRAEAGEAARYAVQNELALRALEDEEVQVRREVAEGLHGSAQQRLVLVTAGLDGLLAELDGTADPATTAVLRDLREKVETVRAADIRRASRLLYPHQIEIGVVPAVRGLLAEVPAAVQTRFVVDPAVRALDEAGASRLTRGERLLVARVVEEAVGNALRHAHATELSVSLDLDGPQILVAVTDDGGGFDRPDATRSGLDRLAERLQLAGGDLRVRSTPGVGVTVSARLPVAAIRTTSGRPA